MVKYLSICHAARELFILECQNNGFNREFIYIWISGITLQFSLLMCHFILKQDLKTPQGC